MIIPPLLISIGITILAYRKRNQFNEGVDYSNEAESKPEAHSAS